MTTDPRHPGPHIPGPGDAGGRTAGPGGARPRRRSRTLKVVLAIVLLLPLLEIITLIVVGKSIGILWTIALLVAMAVLGAWLARRETGRTFAALQGALSSGKMPTDEVTDAILVTIGGFLLILPGFLSDILGILLVLPLTRPTARRLLQTVVAAKALGVTRGGTGGPAGPRRAPGRGQVVEGEIVEGEVISEQPPPGTWPGGNRAIDQP